MRLCPLAQGRADSRKDLVCELLNVFLYFLLDVLGLLTTQGEYSIELWGVPVNVLRDGLPQPLARRHGLRYWCRRDRPVQQGRRLRDGYPPEWRGPAPVLRELDASIVVQLRVERRALVKPRGHLVGVTHRAVGGRLGEISRVDFSVQAVRFLVDLVHDLELPICRSNCKQAFVISAPRHDDGVHDQIVPLDHWILREQLVQKVVHLRHESLGILQVGMHEEGHATERVRRPSRGPDRISDGVVERLPKPAWRHVGEQEIQDTHQQAGTTHEVSKLGQQLGLACDESEPAQLEPSVRFPVSPLGQGRVLAWRKVGYSRSGLAGEQVLKLVLVFAEQSRHVTEVHRKLGHFQGAFEGVSVSVLSARVRNLRLHPRKDVSHLSRELDVRDVRGTKQLRDREAPLHIRRLLFSISCCCIVFLTGGGGGAVAAVTAAESHALCDVKEAGRPQLKRLPLCGAVYFHACGLRCLQEVRQALLDQLLCRGRGNVTLRQVQLLLCQRLELFQSVLRSLPLARFFWRFHRSK
mmetsp:Transcript_12902/g.24404  ORF Transcript_12902/g.24404 Transcript_12902/m.24404 type:complete len:523 (+) Transcript_12902:1629-3197(+)